MSAHTGGPIARARAWAMVEIREGTAGMIARSDVLVSVRLLAEVDRTEASGLAVKGEP